MLTFAICLHPGFDLSAMAEGVYQDAIIDTVEPETLVTNVDCIKVTIHTINKKTNPKPYDAQNLHLATVTPQSLNFSSTFRLTAHQKITKAHAFILYFDTFFTHTGLPVSDDVEVSLVKDGEPALAEVWQIPGKARRKDSTGAGVEKGKEVSFSTGPMSIPTHWKQAIFLLREPIKAEEGKRKGDTLHKVRTLSFSCFL